MWSWLFTLRNCFGNSQKRNRSPSPEPARHNTARPLATSQHHDLVPALPASQALPGARLQWGQDSHPRTPGSQREEVLRPVSATGARQDVGSQGLRSRYAQRSAYEDAVIRRGQGHGSSYYSAQDPAEAQLPDSADAHSDTPNRSPHRGPSSSASPSTSIQLDQIRPVNLHASLVAEASIPDTSAQHLPKAVPNGNQPQAALSTQSRSRHGSASMSTAGPRGSQNVRDSPGSGGPSLLHRAGQISIRTSQAYKSPARNSRTPPIAQAAKSHSRHITKEPLPPKKREAFQAAQRSVSPNPTTLKRKSGNISASPALSAKLPSTSHLRRGPSPKPRAPALNSKQQDIQRAAPRARLTIDVGNSDGKQHQTLSARQSAGSLKAGLLMHRKPSTANPPWLPPSPAKPKAETPRPGGKENEVAQDLQSKRLQSTVEELLGSAGASRQHLQVGVPESPASNSGNSPHKCHFMFSSDNAFGTPSIVGVHNQDEEYREDKRLRVHKTPFELRVDRLIEKEQAYRDQVALRRRSIQGKSVQ